jgi:hypothetical protein
MAIKVNGTTVINDSRQLQNVASVDATTVAALGAAGIGATAEPASGGWGGWTTQTQLASYTNISFSYTFPSDGWYRFETSYSGSGGSSGSIYFNLSTGVSWFRAGSRHDRSYETMSIGSTLQGNYYYNTGNKYWWVFYIESGETLSHTHFQGGQHIIYSLT